MTRSDILNNMLRGVNPSLPVASREKIMDAMSAFSLRQLLAMNRCGLRIWPFVSSIPPEYIAINNSAVELAISTLNTPAAYNPAIRTIRVDPDRLNRGGAINDMRHELAHAWDDIRNDRNRTPLDDLEIPQRRRSILMRIREHERGSQFHSESARRRIRVCESMSTDEPSARQQRFVRLTVSQMRERYLARRTIREESFDNPSTREGHSARTPMEFYAEAYSVFHGNHTLSKAKLLRYAPEMFEYLEQEARENGMPTPDRTDLQRTMQVHRER